MSIHSVETGDHDIADVDLGEMEDTFGTADKLMTVVGDMEEQGGVSREHVAALESIIPGIIMDSFPVGGFTSKPSTQNAEMVHSAVTNWLQVKGYPVEAIATEGFFGNVANAVATGAKKMFAALVTMLNWILSLFRKKSTNKNGISATPAEPVKALKEATKIEETVKQATKSHIDGLMEEVKKIDAEIAQREKDYASKSIAKKAEIVDKDEEARREDARRIWGRISGLQHSLDRVRGFFGEAGDKKALPDNFTHFTKNMAISDITNDVVAAVRLKSFTHLPAALVTGDYSGNISKYIEYWRNVDKTLKVIDIDENLKRVETLLRSFASGKIKGGEMDGNEKYTAAFKKQVDDLVAIVESSKDNLSSTIGSNASNEEVMKAYAAGGDDYVKKVNDGMATLAELIEECGLVEDAMTTVTERITAIANHLDNPQVADQVRDLPWFKDLLSFKTAFSQVFSQVIKISGAIWQYANRIAWNQRTVERIIGDLGELRKEEAFVLFCKKIIPEKMLMDPLKVQEHQRDEWIESVVKNTSIDSFTLTIYNGKKLTL